MSNERYQKLYFERIATTTFFFKYLINDFGGSPATLVFLIVWNSDYRPALETLNTPGTKVVGGHWRGYDFMVSEGYQKYEGSSRSLQRDPRIKANLYSKRSSRTQVSQKALLELGKFGFSLPIASRHTS
jgi:hypothetical protein